MKTKQVDINNSIRIYVLTPFLINKNWNTNIIKKYVNWLIRYIMQDVGLKHLYNILNTPRSLKIKSICYYSEASIIEKVPLEKNHTHLIIFLRTG